MDRQCPSVCYRTGQADRYAHHALKKVTGRTPQLSTSGGTSDARFISRFTDVVEFGLVGQTMHKVNECTPLDDVTTLRQIYTHAIDISWGQ